MMVTMTMTIMISRMARTVTMMKMEMLTVTTTLVVATVTPSRCNDSAVLHVFSERAYRDLRFPLLCRALACACPLASQLRCLDSLVVLSVALLYRGYPLSPCGTGGCLSVAILELLDVVANGAGVAIMVRRPSPAPPGPRAFLFSYGSPVQPSRAVRPWPRPPALGSISYRKFSHLRIS